MPRKFLKRWSPDPEKLRAKKNLKFLRWFLEEPNLFHLNRHSVSVAFLVGLFICFLPVPGHIPLAAFCAFIFRCNLPITFALVWISNPITFPVIFYGCYKLGLVILGLPATRFTFEPSLEWLTTGFLKIWEPLLLGSLACSIVFGGLGYLMVNWLWRWHVLDRWSKRKNRSRRLG